MTMIEVQNIETESVTKHGLPGFVFAKQDVYEQEKDKVFAQGWASIGVGQQLKKPGDILPVRMAGVSLIAIRAKDGSIGVFHNVCRHKSAPLVDEPCNKRTLVCPYHKWSFKLDGELMGAPRFYGDENKPISAEDKADKGLIPVRFAVWWDIIFVNVSGDAQPFEEFIKPLDELLSDYPKEGMQLVSSTDYSGEVNWKLAVDNFLDGYHVPFVHSQACSIESALGQEDLFLSDDIVGLRLANGASNKPAKTAKQIPHWPGLAEDKKGTQQWFGIFPNTLFFVDPVWVQTIVVKPTCVAKTDETLSIYVTSEEAASDEYIEERARLSDVLNEVNEQDIELLDKLQHTRTSTVADQGHLVQAWDQVNMSFQQMWLRKMQSQ